MKSFFIFFSLFFITIAFSSEKNLNFYHSSSQIKKIINSIQCKNIKIGNFGSMYNVYLKSFDKSDHRILLIGNEHANEIITAELFIHLIKLLCSDNPIIKKIRSRSNILLIPLSNEKGREIVENKHDFCHRGNENNIDINRNWNYHWIKSNRKSLTFGGYKPFSTIETLLLKRLVFKYHPTIYGTIHSGGSDCFTPYAYHDYSPSNNIILPILKSSCYDVDYIGPLAHGIKYDSPGNSMDYIHDIIKSRYSFALEIYRGNNENDCFELRNPTTHEEYTKTILKWSKIIVDIFKNILN